MKFTDCLGKRILFFDGAMGTMLQQAGLPAGKRPELWVLEHPEVIQGIHAQYLEAGCDIIEANTFGAYEFNLAGSGHTVEEVVGAAVTLARSAVTNCGREALVALDMGPTGKLLKPLGDLDFEDAVSAFARLALAGAKAGADLILIETMSDLYEIKAAVLGAKQAGLPIAATMVFNDQGRLLTGGDIAAASALLEGLGVSAFGFNCGLGPHQMESLLPKLSACSSIPMIVNPNAGLPHVVNGKPAFDIGPEEFAEVMEKIVRGGAWLVGGCCGTSPAHLKAVIARCKNLSPVPRQSKTTTVVTSYSKTVTLQEGPIFIGSRIHPVKNSAFGKAYQQDGVDAMIQEAFDQVEEGADILSISAACAPNESTALAEAVCEIQTMISAPLQIDTENPEALEQALRLYNGKPLAYPVTQKNGDIVLPLIKKYGAAAVITLDPSDLLSSGKQLLASALYHGFLKKDLILAIPCQVLEPQTAGTVLTQIRQTFGASILVDAAGDQVSPVLLHAIKAAEISALLIDPSLL